MLKVLFMIPNLSHGGAEKVLVNLVNNMDKSKFDVTVQALFADGINGQFLGSDVKFKCCYKKTFRGNSQYFKLYSPEYLYKRFVKERYDIVVSYLEGPTARIVSGCTDKDAKLVSWIHCKIDDEKTAAIGFRSFDEAKSCYAKFDYTACVSEWVKGYFTNTFSFDKPIGVLYNTVESAKILSLAEEAVDDVRFSDDCVNICSVGKVVEVKGFMRLASIHKRLVDEGIKNKVYILGVGQQQAEIERYLSENGLCESFMFLGYRTNPYKYVKNCDLYVCSSYSEGFSTSVTESLIVGTPVVTTLCSGMKEMLGESNEYGIVTENDENALYEGMKTMITTPGMLEDYAKRAKERGKMFDTKTTVKAVEDMLEHLL